MFKRNIFENILSNWASLVVTVAISFWMSPIVVHSLGNELYGVWTLIVSVTGYFTVLDFGVNTAVVRYISSCNAQDNQAGGRRVYSTSLAIFAVIAAVIVLFSIGFGYFFQDIFKLYDIPRLYLYVVFLLSALDLACGLLFSVYLGCLNGLQEFKFINGTSIIVNIIKSVIVVYLLKHGYGLLTLAVSQLCANLARASLEYARIKTDYKYLYFSRKFVDRDTIRHIYNYSIYSFVIAIALKLLFYTDSVVIGSMISVSEVTFYAIPSSLLDYLEKFVWAIIAVLIPLISANEASGESDENVNLYIMGTRYSLLISTPIIVSLYFYGGSFISVWMGPAIGERSQWVLRLLLIGFGLAMSQLIAHGILKGTSKHKVLAYILIIEAMLNLAMSVVLARPYGIEGVAFGTMIPLILATLAIVLYTCRLLRLNIWTYLSRAYSGAVAGLLASLVVVHFITFKTDSYSTVFFASSLVAIAFLCLAVPIATDREHWAASLSKIKNSLGFRSN